MSPGDPPIPRLPERRRLSRRVRDGVAIGFLALFAFVVGLALFNGIIMPRLIHSVAEVRVPDLTSLSYEQAESVLRAHSLRLGRSGERFDPSVPSGIVLAQDPLPDTPVRLRRRVMVLVSLGEEFSAVPEMVGSSVRGATLALDHAGLGFAGITHAASDDVGENMVVASDPPAGTVMPHNGPVGLLISSGPSEELLVMPNLLGRDFDVVQGQMAALGFKVDVQGRGGHSAVIFQTPSPGTQIARGARVVIQGGGRARP